MKLFKQNKSKSKDESGKFRMKYGCIEVEAPTKQDCIDLYAAAAQTSNKYPIQEAIR